LVCIKSVDIFTIVAMGDISSIQKLFNKKFLENCFNDNIKYQFKRLRPTHDVRYSEKIHLINNYKGGTYGFYSAHASNSAAVYVLSVMLIRRSRYKYLLIVYPLLTGISRMYLGVHFLSDVLVGWIMGGIIAFGVYLIFEKYLGLISK
jgi:undecaprenyl-diphosphatase